MNKTITVTVVLKTDHTHEGVKYSAGSPVQVNTMDAGWLVEHGIAEMQHPNAEAKPLNSKK